MIRLCICNINTKLPSNQILPPYVVTYLNFTLLWLNSEIYSLHGSCKPFQNSIITVVNISLSITFSTVKTKSPEIYLHPHHQSYPIFNWPLSGFSCQGSSSSYLGPKRWQQRRGQPASGGQHGGSQRRRGLRTAAAAVDRCKRAGGRWKIWNAGALSTLSVIVSCQGTSPRSGITLAIQAPQDERIGGGEEGIYKSQV